MLLSIQIAAVAQPWSPLTYNPNQTGLEHNPLKGFATMFNPGTNFPRSIDGRLFGLDDIMFGPNNFNWTVIDNFLTQAASSGRHSYIQVNIDPAFGKTDMPTYLINQVDWHFQTGNVPDSCPNWNDPELMAAMLNFVDSFGARYNNDARVYMVHLGLYGMWGEWHIGDAAQIRPQFEMTEHNKTLIANAYKNAFPNKILLARFPENMPDPQAFGYSDGLFFGQSISNSNPYYFHNTLKTYNANKNWASYPVGGEIDPDLQSTIFDVLPNPMGQDVFQCLDSIRPTWLFCHHLFQSAVAGTQEWDNAIRVQKAMGYAFHINQYRLSAANGKPTIEVNIQNKGIAPMYANWDVEFGVLNSANQFTTLGSKKMNLNIIQPNVLNNYRSFFSDNTLADGTYTFLMRVVNPLEATSALARPVRFANTTQDQDRAGWITLGVQTITSGNAGVVPIKVTGLTLTPPTATISSGQTIQLTALIAPADATNKEVTYTTSHPGTASVDANGFVKSGPSYGPVTITAYSNDGTIKAVTTLNVEPNRVQIPALIEAENFIRMSGVSLENASGGGLNLAFIDNNDWMEYGVIVNAPSSFTVDFRVASPSGGGEIGLLNINGDTLGKVVVPNTNGWQNYNTITINNVLLPAGAQDLRVVALKGGFNFNWLEFKNQNVLPIRLLDLKAVPKNDFINIEWTTNFESNNEGFHVERSTDGTNFNKIGWINGQGFSNELQQYSFKDANVVKNVGYFYRLAQQDKDNMLTYSKTVKSKLFSADILLNNLVSVYPNPATNKLTINWNNVNAQNVKVGDVNIYNAAGKKVNPFINNDWTIDLTQLPSGLYFLEVIIKGERITKKFIKN